MKNLFWKEELGQDLVEYTLLIAFVVLSSLAVILAIFK